VPHRESIVTWTSICLVIIKKKHYHPVICLKYTDKWLWFPPTRFGCSSGSLWWWSTSRSPSCRRPSSRCATSTRCSSTVCERRKVSPGWASLASFPVSLSCLRLCESSSNNVQISNFSPCVPTPTTVSTVCVLL